MRPPRKRLPPQELLRERYHYDEDHGHLTNRHNVSGRGGGIGSVVGRIDKRNGRRAVGFNGQYYFEYNLIWMYYYGEDIPDDKEIDHIDNDRDNNRIDNLRLVTHRENGSNRKDTKENGMFSLLHYYRNELPIPDDVREEYNRRQKERYHRKKKENEGE